MQAALVNIHLNRKVAFAMLFIVSIVLEAKPIKFSRIQGTIIKQHNSYMCMATHCIKHKPHNIIYASRYTWKIHMDEWRVQQKDLYDGNKAIPA